MKVAVFGASGYVGGELIRLLLQHPKIELQLAQRLIVKNKNHID